MVILKLRQVRNKEGGRYASNTGKHDDEGYMETPLDDAGEEGSGRQDPNLISSIVQQVVKAMTKKQHGSSSQASNFTCILSFSNVAFNNEIFNSESWIIDYGASDHMSGNSKLFNDIRTLKNFTKVGLPYGSNRVV